MNDLKNLLERLVNNNNFAGKLLNSNSIEEVFEICKENGYERDLNSFRFEFGKLSKKYEVSELNNEELIEISVGAGNFKRIPSVVLSASTIGGTLAPSGFGFNTTISISSVTVSANKNSSKGNRLTDKTIEFAKKHSGPTAVIVADADAAEATVVGGARAAVVLGGWGYTR